MTESAESKGGEQKYGADEALLSMFGDALGRPVTTSDPIAEGELVAALAEVQGRLDTAADLMNRMGAGEIIDAGALDTKALCALHALEQDA